MIKIFNKEHIVSIEIHDKKICKHIQYYENNNKFLSFLYRDTGFYSTIGYDKLNRITKDQLQNGSYLGDIKFIVEDNIVYFRPYVKIKFVNGETYVREFLDLKEAKNWGIEQSYSTMVEYINEFY